MAPIFTEIQSPEQDAANLRAELDSLYRDLCRLFLSHPEPTVVSDDRTLLEGVLAARRGEQAVRTRLEGMQLALNDISEATPAISKAHSTIRSLEEKRTRLFAMLGAVCSEIYDSGTFPGELEPALEPLLVHRSEISALEERLEQAGTPVAAMVANGRLKAAKKRQEQAFVDTGRLVEGCGEAELLPGPKAASIVSDLAESSRQLLALRQEISEKNETISRARLSLGSGARNTRLKNLELELKQKEDQTRLAEEQYGKFLYRNRERWQDAPENADLVRCVSAIAAARHNLYIEQIRARIDALEQARRICSERIGHFTQRMDYLDGEISKLNRQKEDLQAKVESEKFNIESIRTQQQALRARFDEEGDGLDE